MSYRRLIVLGNAAGAVARGRGGGLLLSQMRASPVTTGGTGAAPIVNYLARPTFSEVRLKDLGSYMRTHVLQNAGRLPGDFAHWYWRTFFHAGRIDPLLHAIFLISGTGYFLHNHCMPSLPNV